MSTDDEFAEIDTTKAEFDAMWERATPVNVAPSNARTIVHHQPHSIMTAATKRLGLTPVEIYDGIVAAAKAWREAELNTDYGSTEWQVATERLRDAIDRLPVVYDIGPAPRVARFVDDDEMPSGERGDDALTHAASLPVVSTVVHGQGTEAWDIHEGRI